MDSNNRIYFEWSQSTIIISVVCTAVIIAAIVLMFRNLSTNTSMSFAVWKFLTVAVLVVALFFVLRATPVFLEYDSNGIVLKTVLCKKTFLKSGIVDIKTIDRQTIAGSVRKIGSGGFGGYTGLFNNSQLGDYHMYVTSKKNLVLLSTRDKKYVISCTDGEALITFAREYY